MMIPFCLFLTLIAIPTDDGPSAVLGLVPAEYRDKVLDQLKQANENAAALEAAIREAPADEREALAFLIAHMPVRDLQSLSKDFLLSNVSLAYRARSATPWAENIPKELFYEYVLPYASVNERRDNWREDFYDRFIEIAKTCATPTEAVAKLNIGAFQSLKVSYHATKRPKPDQSPYESTKAGYASCTGLSIILIDACRAVGIPARFVGTPQWSDRSGNHSWVEVWDKEWRFVGACEPSRLNEGWFVEKASKADESNPRHRIYATRFSGSTLTFPMVWKPGSKEVPAEDVTRRYTLRRKVTFKIAEGSGTITVRSAGVIVARDELAPTASFELPGDSVYQVTIDRRGAEAIVREIKLTKDNDQVVELR